MSVEMIAVTFNEVFVTCRKMFEAWGYSAGVYEDAAEGIAFLELHGLDGVQILFDQMAQFENGSEIRPKIIQQTATETVFDLQGQNALIAAPACLDYGCAKLMANDFYMIELQSYAMPLFIMSYLHRCAQRGLYLQAIWHEDGASDESMIHNTLLACPDGALPELRQLVVPKPTEPYEFPAALTIFVRRDSFESFGAARVVKSGNLAKVREISAETLQQNASDRLNNGIAIPLHIWKKFTEIGKGILVPESEQSRLSGAGEQAE